MNRERIVNRMPEERTRVRVRNDDYTLVHEVSEHLGVTYWRTWCFVGGWRTAVNAAEVLRDRSSNTPVDCLVCMSQERLEREPE